MSPAPQPAPRGPGSAARDAPAPRQAFDDYIVGDLSRVANRLARGASALYRRDFGITVTEWRILHSLAEWQQRTASEICDHTGIDKGPISRALRNLQALGHVGGKPDTADTRRIVLRLTGSGRDLHARIMPVAMARQSVLLASLDEAEARQLKRILEKLKASSRTLDRGGSPTSDE